MNHDLMLSSYHYDLPLELVAERPVPGRHHSKLLVYDESKDQIIHTEFKMISKFLPEGSQLVMNQSKVIPCRLLGQKSTGAKAEVFVLGPFGNESVQKCLIRTASKKKIGDVYSFENGKGEIRSIEEDGTFTVAFSFYGDHFESWLERSAMIPIPPYIRGGRSDEQDKVDYQTIYARNVGSVAAPTAGLHFTEDVFQSLEEKKIRKNFITLHVGPGTFAPVKEAVITDHKMHSEDFLVEKSNLDVLNSGMPVFAVGTTALRVLESIFTEDRFEVETDKRVSTDIFLYPGREVKSVRGLLTNFHLPGSSLLMLVSAMIGREKTLELYQKAVENKYRFYSYGDAMLILRKS